MKKKMDRITQKGFKEILEENQNVLLASQFIPNEKYNEYINYISQIKIDDEKANTFEFRKVKRIQTNGIQFSDDSWIHFDNEANEKEYYINNNMIVRIEKYDENFSILVYYIK